MDKRQRSATVRPSISRKLKLLAGYSLWVGGAFLLAQVIVTSLLIGLIAVGVPLKAMNEALLMTIVAAGSYTLAAALAIGAPYLIRKKITSLRELGAQRLVSWRDILIGPLAIIPYFIVSALLLTVVSNLIPGFDISEKQEVGFDQLVNYFEVILAFLTLVVIAPIAEELLFRGYLYGKLRRRGISLILASLVVSILFGALHGQWNVALDTFALSMVLCGLRELTGSIWAGTLLHMTKNGIAFYILFINPSISGMM